MRYVKASVPAILAAALYVGGGLVLSAVVGCGEPEMAVKPTDKNKDQLQKEIENPFGEVTPKAKGKGSRRKS